MCVVAIAWQAHPRWRLVVAANRDEFHDRPAAALHVWPNGDAAGTIAGRDLRSGGTWLGVRPEGRCVLVTNYRVPGYPQPDRPSRGVLVTSLLGDADPMRIAIAEYNPFNLFRADVDTAHILTNHPTDIRRPVSPGIHGLSNGAYDEPWPKTLQLCGAVADWLAGPADDITALFPALADATPLAARANEGPGDARFSSVFIRDALYGTRCSTVLAIDRDGRGSIVERSFDADAQPTGEVAIAF
jgi:uncharacterized protein with NRDE domain